ncbi:phosphotransferase [Serinicoccus sp. LYQ131]|uniref:phosphotransferase n=1 Tax=Serinicoccus sp. LYQ131 TaxID=3378797 RepID=UPI003853F446
MAEDPTLELLLDPQRLSALLRTPVRVAHLRPKPGVRHTAVLLTPDGAVQGWAQVLVGEARVKGAKARARAEELGLDRQLSTLPLPQWDADLLWGGVATDLDLMTPLARAGLDLNGPDVTLLRYNPSRRVVARIGGHVVRVTVDRHRRSLRALGAALAEQGMPVLTQVPAERVGLTSTSRLSVWPWVEGHDLAQAHTGEQLAEAGGLLARLHGLDPTRLPELPRRGWSEVRQAAGRAMDLLERVAPDQAYPVRLAWESLPADLAGSAPVLLHGDFSLDQCLAGERRLWLTDLDRACVGPPELDLASAQAATLVDAGEEDPADLTALVEGYGGAAVPGPWVAAALLSRISEPWRGQRPGWQARTTRLARLALELADRTPGWQVPAAVEDHGTRVRVERAWPGGSAPRGGPGSGSSGTCVAVEGHDDAGLLRAGTLRTDGTLHLLPHAEDPRLPSLAAVARGGSLLVHRAGRRAVVHRPDGYVKVVRAGRGPAVAQASRTGAGLVEQAGLLAAAVLDEGEDTVRFAALPGTPVQRLSADGAWPTLWDGWAQAWSQLQRLEAPGLPAHTAVDEAEVLHTWRDRALGVGVLAGTPWAERLTRTAAELQALPPTRLVPTHRDLHDGQLLWDGQHLAVLDLDTLCRAEPALDLANLAVHAGLREAQGAWSPTSAQVVAEATVRVAVAAEVDPQRWAQAYRATVARLVAVYAFRPRWRDTVLSWAQDEWAWLEAAGTDESLLIRVSQRSPQGEAGSRP